MSKPLTWTNSHYSEPIFHLLLVAGAVAAIGLALWYVAKDEMQDEEDPPDLRDQRNKTKDSS